jgi:hypothetical protein
MSIFAGIEPDEDADMSMPGIEPSGMVFIPGMDPADDDPAGEEPAGIFIPGMFIPGMFIPAMGEPPDPAALMSR